MSDVPDPAVPQDPPLDPAVLDDLWDFDDVPASERRLRAAMDTAGPLAAAELTTQLARALGLQDRFDDARALLGPLVTHPSPLVRARQALETGRVLRSGGDPAASVPHFESALALATVAADDYLRIDAMHMLALVATDGDDWTERALTAAADAAAPRAQRWAGALYNNRGWARYDRARYPEALADFELALDAYQRYGTAEQVRFAYEALDSCRRALDDNGQG